VIRRIVLSVLLALTAASVPALAQRQGSVTRVTARVVPTNWHGACPHPFEFTATLISRAPGTVYYVWERSDNSSTPRQSTTFGRGGESKVVRTQWSPNHSGSGTLHGWVRLQVEDGPRSAPAPFILQCRQ
jgi:hypothetical protein